MPARSQHPALAHGDAEQKHDLDPLAQVVLRVIFPFVWVRHDGDVVSCGFYTVEHLQGVRYPRPLPVFTVSPHGFVFTKPCVERGGRGVERVNDAAVRTPTVQVGERRAAELAFGDERPSHLELIPCYFSVQFERMYALQTV